MNKAKRVSSYIFIVMLFVVSGLNIYQRSKNIISDVKKMEIPYTVDGISMIPRIIEEIITGDFVFNYELKRIYGVACNYLDKKEILDYEYVLDKNGYMHSLGGFGTETVSEQEMVLRIRQLQDDMRRYNSNLIVLIFPPRINLKQDTGYYGMSYDDGNPFTDVFVKYLRRYNVGYIDYRDEFENSGIDSMYATDWGMRTKESFITATILRDRIKNNTSEELSLEVGNSDLSNYSVVEYKEMFRGRMSRNLGGVLVPDEDYTYIYPSYNTEFEVVFHRDDNLTREHGDFETCFVDEEVLKENDKTKMYRAYKCAQYDSLHVTNILNEDSPKVLYIGDSNVVSVPTFMTLMFSEIEITWLEHCDDEYLQSVVKEYSPDYVIIGVTQDAIKHGNIKFCEEAVDKKNSEEVPK